MRLRCRGYRLIRPPSLIAKITIVVKDAYISYANGDRDGVKSQLDIFLQFVVYTIMQMAHARML